MLHQIQRSPLQQPSKRALQRLVNTALLMGALVLSPVSTWALTLGTMKVQSALGEPLRAQLSLGELTPEELNSIDAGFAPAAVYRAAGITANPALNNIQISVDKSIPTNVVVNMTSSNAMNEPFLDMLLEIKWSSGTVIRDYTLLFAAAEPSSAAASTEPVVAGVPALTEPLAVLPVESEATPGIAIGSVLDADPAALEPLPVTAPEPAAQVTANPAQGINPIANKSIRVVRGDTASRLARDNMPEGVSLDQMLQAMLRANPNAFVNNNVNRLKAGVNLTVPDAQAALSIDPSEARRLFVAQSRDFNAYRRSLAANAPTQSVAQAGQVATGQIETQIQDKAEAEPATDQLTLSKGSVASGTDAEAQIASARQAQDEQVRQDELSRNIEELSALAAAAPNDEGGGTSLTDDTTGITVASIPEAPEDNATALPPEPVDNTAATTALQRLLEKPWALPFAFGLLALLAVLVFTNMTRRQQNRADKSDQTTAHETAANDQRVTDEPASGLTFNLDDIDLDLTPTEVPGGAEGANSEALFTKFELAKEFLSLGDRVAAKALAQEVQADATGMLKRRAEMFLNELG